MSRSTPADRRDDERGASIFMVMAALVALMMSAALVVDLGVLQVDRRNMQTAADNAAAAAISELDTNAGGSAKPACRAAAAYVKLGLPDDSLPDPTCNEFVPVCDPTTERSITIGDGSYSVTLTHPVTDTSPLMAGQAANPLHDGTPCQRFGVDIRRERDHWFAVVSGFQRGGTSSSAVARVDVGAGSGELVPLLVLDPIACDALYTSGQGGIEIMPNGSTPGFIVVDSDGSLGGNNSPGCGNANRYTIDAQGNTNGFIRALPSNDGAPAAILSYALWTAQAAKSYDPNDLNGTPPRLSPQPTAQSERIGRAPVDWRYNCKASYPNHLGFPVAGCLTAPAPHIDNLVAQLGGIGTPAGYQVYPRTGTDPATGQPYADTCTTQTSTPAITVPPGNWFVNCAAFGVSSPVTFQSGNVVFRGPVTVDSGTGHLTINANATNDAVAYVRAGNFTKGAQGRVTMNRTLVYLTPGTGQGNSITGRLDFGGGSGSVTWTAPTTGNFEDLGLWAEAADLHRLAGQADWFLEGTLFTPNANPFRLTGQGGVAQMRAQFLTRRLEVAGQGTVQMIVQPDRITPLPKRVYSLIR